MEARLQRRLSSLASPPQAVHLGEPVLVKALLRGGASLQAQDRYGKTALEVARTRSIAQPSDARALVVSLIESAAERAHAAGLARAVREAPRGAVLRVADLAARLGEGEDKDSPDESGLAEPAPTLEGVKLHAEESCVVCLQAGAASVALLPCGHQCLCRECTCKTLAGLVVPLPDETDGCPVCRTTVTAIVVLVEEAAEVIAGCGTGAGGHRRRVRSVIGWRAIGLGL